MINQPLTEKQPAAAIDLFEDQTQLRSREAFQNYCRQVLSARLAFEKRLADQGRDRTQWNMAGYCQACEKIVPFVLDWHSSDKVRPNFRERLVCPGCHLNNRQRFSMGLLKHCVKAIEDKQNSAPPVIYLYEQVTPFYHYTSRHFTQARIIGSEYFGFEHQSGEIINGIRHEDAMAMSFESNSIDLIMSNDVYEHVPNYQQALKEAWRVIKPGGLLVFSIPFYADCQETRLRAIIENGKIKSLMEEQYHGNPMLNKGSLVFNDFGWDILDDCKSVGFKDAYVLGYYSVFYGNIGNGSQQIFIARK